VHLLRVPFALAALLASTASAQDTGSVRGVVFDGDFDVPLSGAQVLLVELTRAASTTDQGAFLLTNVPAGTYTLVATKEGYARVVRPNVLVAAGRLTDVGLIELAGEFTDLDEFVVEDILGATAGTEAALLNLRLETPALIDSISSELMTRAGVGDAAAALRLVAGATVAENKSAVIRGLPDRYVSSQLNRVRLPSADEDKRAVELDQFPSGVIESIQVSKTFTPDQQGDASGGAVDVRLRSIPEETVFRLKLQRSYNTNVAGRNDFLTYDGGGVDFFGSDDGDRDVQLDNLGQNWTGAVGVTEGDAPTDYKWSLDAGKKLELENGMKLGGFATLFYERDSAFYDNGVLDSWWLDRSISNELTPEANQGLATSNDFKTGLYDVTQGSQSVQWGGLATIGMETERSRVGLTYLYSRTAEDTATLAEDTRGKAFFFPGYDPNNPTGPGNQFSDRSAAPYLRQETLEYTERTTDSLQLAGTHELPVAPKTIGPFLFQPPELSWIAARSSATLDQPDKRLFSSLFLPASDLSGTPIDPLWIGYFPASNVNLGNLQRIFKAIEEDSTELAADLKWPFEQWSGESGYVKLGVFQDKVERSFDQNTFSNFGDFSASFPGTFDQFWSEFFPFEDHPITQSPYDIDYKGDIEVAASYGMLDLPLAESLHIIGGVRFEHTNIQIQNFPGDLAFWIPPGDTAPRDLDPGDADVDFGQYDTLPAIGFEYEPIEKLMLRTSYSRTIARQTFKELTPIIQQEFSGGPIFIGNPSLEMSDLQNFDLRLDYSPYPGGFASVSWFKKRIENPIEYVQKLVDFTFTTPVNYRSGDLEGYELELRQDLGHFRENLEGLSIGANATFIQSQVELTADEQFDFGQLGVPHKTRDMVLTPDHLYNLYATYAIQHLGTELSVFYTVKGDTLVAGAGKSAFAYVPDVYAQEYGTLNFSLSCKLGHGVALQFQAKNLTDPEIEEVFHSEFVSQDQTRSSFTRGREYSLGISVNL
jgi:hypothetical protein